MTKRCYFSLNELPLCWFQLYLTGHTQMVTRECPGLWLNSPINWCSVQSCADDISFHFIHLAMGHLMPMMSKPLCMALPQSTLLLQDPSILFLISISGCLPISSVLPHVRPDWTGNTSINCRCLLLTKQQLLILYFLLYFQQSTLR